MTNQIKIEKPYPDFPLNPHLGSGTWRKKIKGRVKHFGSLDDPAGALREFEAWKAGPGYSGWICEAEDRLAEKRTTPRPAKKKASNPQVTTVKTSDLPEGLKIHPNGSFYAKIKGKVCYFGRASGKNCNVAKSVEWFTQEKSQWDRGEIPERYRKESGTEGLRLEELVRHFFHAKELLVQSGTIRQVTCDGYKPEAARILEFFGPNQIVEELGPDDFTRLYESIPKIKKDGQPLSKTRLKNIIVRIKVILNHATDKRVKLIDGEMLYGAVFQVP